MKSAHAIDDKTKKFYNCEVCHLASAKAPVAPPGGWTDNFAPKTEFFKASPEQHSSCFNCHWDKQYPTRNDCKGCHDLAPSYVPSGAPKRFSMKFDHSRPNDHVKECTACHINITKSKTVRGLKPDVPITACTECHNHDGLRQDLNKELEALDKNKAFVCVYCHTSDVGKRDPKPSHYLVAGRKPLERKDLK